MRRKGKAKASRKESRKAKGGGSSRMAAGNQKVKAEDTKEASQKERTKVSNMESPKASQRGSKVERKEEVTLDRISAASVTGMVIGVEIVPNVLNKSRTATSTVATTKTDFRDNKCC